MNVSAEILLKSKRVSGKKKVLFFCITTCLYKKRSQNSPLTFIAIVYFHVPVILVLGQLLRLPTCKMDVHRLFVQCTLANSVHRGPFSASNFLALQIYKIVVKENKQVEIKRKRDQPYLNSLIIEIGDYIQILLTLSLFSSHRKNWFAARCECLHRIKKNSQCSFTCCEFFLIRCKYSQRTGFCDDWKRGFNLDFLSKYMDEFEKQVQCSSSDF